VLVAISKGMLSVKLCSSRILQFLTGAGLANAGCPYDGCKMLVVVFVVVFLMLGLLEQAFC